MDIRPPEGWALSIGKPRTKFEKNVTGLCTRDRKQIKVFIPGNTEFSLSKLVGYITTLLHEIRHAWQFEEGWERDKKPVLLMEMDANEVALSTLYNLLGVENISVKCCEEVSKLQIKTAARKLLDLYELALMWNYNIDPKCITDLADECHHSSNGRATAP